MASHKAFFQARELAVRLLLAIFMVAPLLAVLAMPAEAASVPRKYAGIVVDAKTGKVLYESSADAARYPASVTKVMTLYVLFQELEAGNITLKTKFTVSKAKASADDAIDKPEIVPAGTAALHPDQNSR